MKINCHLDPNLAEEHGELWLRKMTPQINDLLQELSSTDETLWCYKENEIIPVKYEDIYALQVAKRNVAVITSKATYIYNDRLSNLKVSLPNYFLPASRSSIFNYRFIDHLELVDNGLIDVVLINKYRVQISRRNIKQLKERLGI